MSVRLIFEDHKLGTGLLFENPVAEIIAITPQEVKGALRSVDEWRRQGYYLAGYVAYEAAYGLIEKEIHPPSWPQEPLVRFFVFQKPVVLEGLTLFEPLPPQPGQVFDFQDTLSSKTYQEKLSELRPHFISGNTYQTNFTFRRRFQTSLTKENLYAYLREQQKVAYGAFLEMPEFSVLSFSPELFLRKKGTRLTTQPMKGTSNRGSTPEEDQAQKSFLQNDEKIRAENVMIVDLLRNDLGRIAHPGTVQVENLFEVQTFETLHQMVTTIHGDVDAEIPLLNVFESLFPCGSITGAPKLKTMELIAKLESEPRGIYTGAIGFITPENDFTFNVAIRTLTQKSDKIFEMGLGGGILLESVPEQEYQECLLKSRFLQRLNEGIHLIETFLFRGGGDFAETLEKLSPHFSRLEASCRYWGIALKEPLLLLLRKALQDAQGLQRVRLSISYDGKCQMETAPFVKGPQGGTVVLCQTTTNSQDILLQHKTSLRSLYEREYEKAQAAGHYEVLFMNENKELTEASRHNLFLRQGSVWKTPPVRCGLLPGVTRAEMLKNFSAIEEVLNVDDLKRADEIILTNSVRGCVPVQWEGEL